MMKAATMRAVVCAAVLLALMAGDPAVHIKNNHNNIVQGNFLGIRAHARANAVTDELLHAAGASAGGESGLSPSHLQHDSEHELPTSLTEDGEIYYDYDDVIDPAYYTASPQESGGHEVHARQASSPVSPSAILTGEVSIRRRLPSLLPPLVTHSHHALRSTHASHTAGQACQDFAHIRRRRVLCVVVARRARLNYT